MVMKGRFPGCGEIVERDFKLRKKILSMNEKKKKNERWDAIADEVHIGSDSDVGEVD